MIGIGRGWVGVTISNSSVPLFVRDHRRLCLSLNDEPSRVQVLVVSDKCGDAYAAPLPDPSVALKHLLGHTAMTITAMVYLKGGGLLATADRAEHIRVSQVRQALAFLYGCC